MIISVQLVIPDYTHVIMYETFPSGRRLDELNPGEYKGTKNSQKPVVVEGHWEEPTPEEQQKHDTVHKLQVWLENSQLCVLSVNLTLSKNDNNPTDLKKILNFLKSSKNVFLW